MGKKGHNERTSTNSKGAGNGKKGDRHRHHKGNSTQPRRHKKVEVKFNPTDRHDYLTGFSSRKKERRAFGLAMQKVKDREAKLEERKEQRQAQLEKIEDIERNKVALRKGISGDTAVDEGGDNASSDDDDGSVQNGAQHNEQEMKTFKDDHTTHQFGGLVSVTTTFGIPSDDDDDDSINGEREFYSRTKHGADHVDEAQKRAGNFQTYIADVKGTLGQKKKGGGGKNGGKKGMHGASSMKGMGNAASLKVAKRTLAKFKAKGGKGGADSEKGAGRGRSRDGKKGKGRR